MSMPDITALLALWQATAGGTAVLVNHSENHTYRVAGPRGVFSLRLHRPDYQSPDSIASELDWLAALRRDTNLSVPQPVVGRNGALLQSITTPQGPRHAVLFRHIDGEEPALVADLSALFGTLGTYAARLHEHASTWARPQGFTRQAWSAAHILDANGLWGNWRTAPGMDAGIRDVLDRADAALRSRLSDYGTGADRFGLIHADMRLGNLLIDQDRVSLIDFDDCGFCWFAYDFAAAISFYEIHPSIPALKSAWLASYAKSRNLSNADIEIIDAMVLLRRMALLAWIGSHNETALAQSHAPGFAEGTAQLAAVFLNS